MSKFIGIAVGFGEAVAGGAIAFLSAVTGTVFLLPLAVALINVGIGTMVAGTGTLIASLISGGGSGGSQSPQQGVAVASRNPTASYRVVYGRAAVGGMIFSPGGEA